MDAIGAQLRQAREERSLSLEEVAESTRITVQNLAAIEEDRFECFPNRVYARAFLRDYANFLGLDSQALLEQYEEARASTPEPPIAAKIPPRRTARLFGYTALVLVVVCGLAALAYVGWRLRGEYTEITKAGPSRPHSDKATDLPEQAKAEPPVPETPAEAPVDAPVTPPPAEPVPAAPTPSAPAAPDRLTLQISALETVWVSVLVDGQRVLYTTIPKGTTRVFEARKKIQIRAGRANAVQIEQDGRKFLLGPDVAPLTRGFAAPAAVPQAAPR